MNKQDLIDQVVGKTGLTKAVVTETLEAITETISSTLLQDEDVRLTGFGTFRLAERKASEGRNPRTGELIQIAPTRSIKFRQGAELKDMVNNRRRKEA